MTQARFQEATFFCDFNHPAVSSLARKLASGETDHRKITEAVFQHVRDNLRFGADSVQVKASETLTKGYGACYNKALLMIALLRSNHIPARLAYYPVKREFMRPAIGEACTIMQEPFNHCFVQVQLDDRWISIDATLDARTYQKLFAPHGVAWGIDWNGKDDMQLYADNIAGPAGYFEDMDSAIRRNVGNVLPADAMFEPINQQMWRAIDIGPRATRP
jgi:transglutaminase-like putative cysteine protease